MIVEAQGTTLVAVEKLQIRVNGRILEITNNGSGDRWLRIKSYDQRESPPEDYTHSIDLLA